MWPGDQPQLPPIPLPGFGPRVLWMRWSQLMGQQWSVLVSRGCWLCRCGRDCVRQPVTNIVAGTPVPEEVRDTCGHKGDPEKKKDIDKSMS